MSLKEILGFSPSFLSLVTGYHLSNRLPSHTLAPWCIVSLSNHWLKPLKQWAKIKTSLCVSHHRYFLTVIERKLTYYSHSPILFFHGYLCRTKAMWLNWPVRHLASRFVHLSMTSLTLKVCSHIQQFLVPSPHVFTPYFVPRVVLPTFWNVLTILPAQFPQSFNPWLRFQCECLLWARQHFFLAVHFLELTTLVFSLLLACWFLFS